MDSPGRTSAIIPLKPDTDYIFWKTEGSDKFRVAIFNHEPKVGSIPTLFINLDYGTNPSDEFIYTTKSDETFALVH